MKKLGDTFNDKLEDYGGKRSVYEIDKKIDKIKKIIKNPKCAEYLFSKLKNNEFFKKYMTYIVKSMFSVTGKNESAYLQSYRFGAEILKKDWTQKEFEDAQLICHHIQNTADAQIDEIVDGIIDEMEKEKERVCIMVLLCGLLKI